MGARSFVVTVAVDNAELAADRLWQAGVRAVEERATGDGRVELWTVVGDADAAIAAVASTLDDGWRWRIEDADDEWPQTWREHALPMVVGERLTVVPAWHEHDVAAGERVVVRIEPGAAFGLGDHPTTALTLAALEREVSLGTAATVLDVGCGTGVLAIAASMLGVDRARAVDVSAAAVESTIANARLNGVSEAVDCDTTPVSELAGVYDLVVANILAPALVAMSDDLRRLPASHGRLVVSGVLAGAHHHVLEALAPMQPIRTDTSGGWAAVTLAHR